MMRMFDGNSSRIFWSLLILLGVIIAVWATPGYYRTYQVFGSGDNMVATMCAHGGPGAELANRKWNVECLDGEAVIGILDGANDYTNIAQVWCKFMFPYKPPTNGIYPYYPSCFSKNFTTQFFCYTPRYHEPSVNSFVVGFWDNEFAFNIYRKYLDDSSPYKCCKAPTGYYIDYQSCYYQPTHDQYWEYYDTPVYFFVVCSTGYVMTGLAKKVNPFTTEYHIEWIQCCRMGFGSGPNIPPPPQANYYYQYDNASYAASSYAGGDEPPSKPRPGGPGGRSLEDDRIAMKNPSGALQLLTNEKGTNIFAN